MSEATTIDKKTFSVDMKIVWACAAALVYGANMAADWRNKVENFMALQATQNNEIKQTPARVQLVESDVKALKESVAMMAASQKEQTVKMETISESVRGIQSTVNTISQALRDKR